MKRTVAVITLVAFIAAATWAQSGEPVPLEEEEFPRWALDLRRGEIIFFGILPFSLLFTSLGYSLIRYGVHNFDPAYAPAISPGPDTVPMSQGEVIGVILTGIGLSLVAAITDFIIGRIIDKREAERETAREIES
ncbi:MAG: hypothetical protein ACOCYA_01905 [Spirochaetota bacterium]